MREYNEMQACNIKTEIYIEKIICGRPTGSWYPPIC